MMLSMMYCTRYVVYGSMSVAYDGRCIVHSAVCVFYGAEYTVCGTR